MTQTIRYVEEGDVIYINECGQYHREDGPAIMFDHGGERWYYNGRLYTKDNHPFNVFYKEYNLSENYSEWPNDMKILCKLTYGGNV
jgi:hypothetical protein